MVITHFVLIHDPVWQITPVVSTNYAGRRNRTVEQKPVQDLTHQSRTV